MTKLVCRYHAITLRKVVSEISCSLLSNRGLGDAIISVNWKKLNAIPVSYFNSSVGGQAGEIYSEIVEPHQSLS